MIVPHLKASFSENLRAGVRFSRVKKVLTKGSSTNISDEGGFTLMQGLTKKRLN